MRLSDTVRGVVASHDRRRPRYRSTILDRVLAPARTVTVLGPIAGLDEESIRAVLREAELSSPSARLALDARGDVRTWNYRSDISVGSVTRPIGYDTSDLGLLMTAIRNRPGHPGPLEVMICDEYLVLDYSHGVGDGQLGIRLLAALSGDADTSRTRVLAKGLPRNSVWRALWRHYGANPSALRDFWRSRQSNKRADGDVGPTRRIEDWESGKRSVAVYMAPARVAELRAWGESTAPGSSGPAVTVALWIAALEAEGVPLDERVMILFNCRRYLSPEYRDANGNFAVGVPIRLPKHPSPPDVASGMRQVIDSGWPIAILGMDEVRDLMPSRSAVPASTAVDVPAKMRLAVSDLGNVRVFDHVTWSTGGPPPQMAAFLEPDGPDGISLLVTQIEGARTYSAAFCSKAIDPSIVDAALRRMCDDPVGVLTGAARTG